MNAVTQIAELLTATAVEYADGATLDLDGLKDAAATDANYTGIPDVYVPAVVAQMTGTDLDRNRTLRELQAAEGGVESTDFYAMVVKKYAKQLDRAASALASDWEV